MGVELFTQSLPVEVHEGVLFGNFPDNAIGDASAVAEAGEVKLPHFSTAAHVVHQVERVSFAANEGHRLTPKTATLCSVLHFHYKVQRGPRTLDGK